MFNCVSYQLLLSMTNLNKNSVNFQGAFSKGAPSQTDMYRPLSGRIQIGWGLPAEVPMLFGSVGAVLFSSKKFSYFFLKYC